MSQMFFHPRELRRHRLWGVLDHRRAKGPFSLLSPLGLRTTPQQHPSSRASTAQVLEQMEIYIHMRVLFRVLLVNCLHPFFSSSSSSFSLGNVSRSVSLRSCGGVLSLNSKPHVGVVVVVPLLLSTPTPFSALTLQTRKLISSKSLRERSEMKIHASTVRVPH